MSVVMKHNTFRPAVAPDKLTYIIEEPAVVEGAGGVQRTGHRHHEQGGHGEVVQQVLHRLQARLPPVEHEDDGGVTQHGDGACRDTGNVIWDKKRILCGYVDGSDRRSSVIMVLSTP